MKSVLYAALAALLSVAAQAVPMAGHDHLHGHLHHKRDVVWVTKLEILTKTVVVTVTADAAITRQAAYAAVAWSQNGAQQGGSPGTYNTARHSQANTAAESYVARPTSSRETVVPTTATVAAPYTSATYVSPLDPPVPQTTQTTTAPPAPQTTEAYTPPPAPVVTTQSLTSPSVAAVSEYVPTTTSSVAALAYSLPTTSAAGLPSSSTGEMTWYQVGLGACGWTNTEDEDIVAIARTLYDRFTPGTNPNANTLCGKTVTITGIDGKQHVAKLADRCEACHENDLDLSSSLFKKVTLQDDGRVPGITWAFN